MWCLFSFAAAFQRFGASMTRSTNVRPDRVVYRDPMTGAPLPTAWPGSDGAIRVLALQARAHHGARASPQVRLSRQFGLDPTERSEC